MLCGTDYVEALLKKYEYNPNFVRTRKLDYALSVDFTVENVDHENNYQAVLVNRKVIKCGIFECESCISRKMCAGG